MRFLIGKNHFVKNCFYFANLNWNMSCLKIGDSWIRPKTAKISPSYEKIQDRISTWRFIMQLFSFLQIVFFCLHLFYSWFPGKSFIVYYHNLPYNKHLKGTFDKNARGIKTKFECIYVMYLVVFIWKIFFFFVVKLETLVISFNS